MTSQSRCGRLLISAAAAGILTVACVSAQPEDATTTAEPETTDAAPTTTTPEATDATATLTPVAEPVDIGIITITKTECLSSLAGGIHTGQLTATVLNQTEAQTAAEVFRLREGHSFDELITHLELEKERADAGEPFIGPPELSATFASEGTGIMDAGDSSTLAIEAGEAGTYAIYCFRHHDASSDPFRPFALIGPLQVTEGQGRITIVTKIDFSQRPFNGTFEVTQGGELLGCLGGTFVDADVSGGVEKVLTCEAGSREGTFTVVFNAKEVPGPGDLNGPWSITAATHDFASLQGSGDFSIDFEDSVETLTGEVYFGSTAPTLWVANAFMDALAAKNGDAAVALFASNGDFDGMDPTTLIGWAEVDRAIGRDYTNAGCAEVPPSTSSEGASVIVDCRFTMQFDVARAQGLEPGRGTYRIHIDEGQIDSSTETWDDPDLMEGPYEVFYAWLDQNHPGAEATIRSGGLPRFDPESIALWEQYTDEFVAEMGG